VFAAYGWPVDLTDEELLERLLDLNLERAGEEARGGHRQRRTDILSGKALPEEVSTAHFACAALAGKRNVVAGSAGTLAG
jgi:hypothetical protein